MRYVRVLIFPLILCLLAACSEKIDRPNIVLILADDLGYGDVGFNGSRDIPTPNIDSIAAQGVRFVNGYSSHPFCSPMRAGLMTGRYQHRFGYVNNVPFDPHNDQLGLPTSELTIARRLQEAGYQTGMVGKWHLGAASDYHPLNRGFDFFYGFLGGGHDYFTVDTRKPLKEGYYSALDDNGSPVAFDGYLTKVLTDQAIRFIRGTDDRPWFLYVSYNAPHEPLQAPKDKIAEFSSIKDNKRRVYAAMVSSMDDQIGRLLRKIDETGELDNTLVVFLSDNGGPELANGSDNGPLRGGKGDVYEGGIHVPFVMQMPGTLPRGLVYESPVISLDVSQTVLELAGIPRDEFADGVNLFPFVMGENKSVPHDALFWRTVHDGQWAVRRGDDKLVILRGEESLYDLGSDLEESTDVAVLKPQVVDESKALLNHWAKANKPAIFPGYGYYHELLGQFSRKVRADTEASDQSVSFGKNIDETKQ